MPSFLPAAHDPRRFLVSLLLYTNLMRVDFPAPGLPAMWNTPSPYISQFVISVLPSSALGFLSGSSSKIHWNVSECVFETDPYLRCIFGLVWFVWFCWVVFVFCVLCVCFWSFASWSTASSTMLDSVLLC